MVFENIFLQLPMGNEWIILLIVAVIFIFGAKKIPGIAKSLGLAKGQFEKGKIEGEKELKDFKDKEVKSD